MLQGRRTKGIKEEGNVIKRVTKGVYVNYRGRQIYLPGFYTIIIIIIIMSGNNYSERENSV